MAKYYPFGGTTYNLGTSIGSTDTSIILSSFLEPVTGVPYTMVLLNTDIAFGTIAPKTTSSEFISFTGITQNANGSATLTGVTRGLAKKYPFTTDAAYKLPHSGQSQFIISDAPQVFQEYVSNVNDQTVGGIKTFSVSPLVPTGGTGTQAANATDIANAISGATGTATNLVFGTVKLSVAAVSGPNPIAVGDNDPRIVTTGISGGIIGFTSTTARQSSVLLTQHALVVGGGAGATPTPLASLGTTTTVLHGNASGDPTYGAVVLTTDVSGVLPVANGGQVSYTNGTTTKNAADASTTQNIAHGLGRVPKKVKIHCSVFTFNASNSGFQGFADTIYNGTTQSSQSIYGSNTTSISTDNSFTLNTNSASGATQIGVVTFDATNIIITWTKTGSPTGNYQLLWEAEG